MAVPKTFNLDRIVDIIVEVSALSAPRATFNELLILGSSEVIDPDDRILTFEAADDMLDEGFSLTDPEYIAAQIYFAQNPAPRILWVGRQDLTASPAESCLEALVECRKEGYEWYFCVALNADSDDHEEIALWAESVTPSTIYAFTTEDEDVLDGETSPNNICQKLQALGYSNTMAQWASTQNDEYPNNIYAIIAALGYACGQISGLADSAFTLKFKEEVGIAVERLTATEVLNLEGVGANVYLSYGNYYNFIEQGVMIDGTFFDEKVNLDVLVNNIQLSIADLLNQNPKIPQTDAGVTQLIGALNSACRQAVTIGFLAPGTWTGDNILNLKNGDVLPKGYMVQAQDLADQADADRQLRKSPSLYVAVKLAGAMHSIIIGVYVNR